MYNAWLAYGMALIILNLALASNKSLSLNLGEKCLKFAFKSLIYIKQEERKHNYSETLICIE